MSSGLDQLQRIVDKLRSLGPAEVERIAPRVAAETKTEIDAQIGRAQFPSGAPWPLTQSGQVPLRTAAKSVTVRNVGTVVVCRVAEPEAYHHRGQTRGNVVRQILPSRRLPVAISKAIARVYREEIRKAVKA